MAKRTIGVNDRYEYPADKSPAYKAPGIYKVTQDIQNPNYDKRSNDFHRQEVIKAGTKVLLTDNRCRDYVSEGDRFFTHGCRVSKLNDRAYDRIDSTFYCYEDLMAHIEPVEGVGTEDYLTNLKHQNGYSADPEYILMRLLNTGVITREQVEVAVKQNDEDE